MFLLLTLEGCLWQLNQASITSGKNHAGLPENGRHEQDLNGMIILPSVVLRGVVWEIQGHFPYLY